MPVKFKPTIKQRRRGGGVETVHYYMHKTPTEELLEYLDQNHREVLESIVNEGKITKDNEKKLDKSILNFKKSFSS